MEKIKFSELQDLRSSLWENRVTRKQRYRLVDVIHLLMDCSDKVDYKL